MKGRPGHRSCHQCLMPLFPRISPHVDLTEWMPAVGSLSHARALLPAWIQMPFWQLSYAREKEDKVSFPCCGITKNSSCVFKLATMLKCTRVGRPAQVPLWVWSGIRLSTNLGGAASDPTIKGIPHSPAVATKHAWTAGSQAFGWNTLHSKPREQLTEMKHTAWIQVPWPKSAPIVTKS